MMRSCLFVIDGMKAAKLGAYLYYLLEDNGVTVNFASASRLIDKEWSAVDVKEKLQQHVGEERSSTKAFHRFIEDENAIRKLCTSIALDRAMLFTGVSYDGVCLVGDELHRDAPGQLDKMIKTMHHLQRAVAALGLGATELLKRDSSGQEKKKTRRESSSSLSSEEFYDCEGCLDSWEDMVMGDG